MTGPAPARSPIRCTGVDCQLWLGRRLVTGSSSGVVRLDLEPPARARLAAAQRPRVRELWVSVDDPGGLVAVPS